MDDKLSKQKTLQFLKGLLQESAALHELFISGNAQMLDIAESIARLNGMIQGGILLMSDPELKQQVVWESASHMCASGE